MASKVQRKHNIWSQPNKGKSGIDTKLRLTKSVVQFLKHNISSTRSKRGKGSSLIDNSTFIDNFFNCKDRQDHWKIRGRSNAGLEHVQIAHIAADQREEPLFGSQLSRDLFDLEFKGSRRPRVVKQRKWRKWRLKKGKIHRNFINEQIEKEKGTLTIGKVYPLHEMWNQYVKRVIELQKDSLLEDVVCRLDLHGCLVKIIICKARKCYVNYQGIIVLVSKNRMGMVTTLPVANKLIIVPFQNTLFTFEINGRVVRGVNGNLEMVENVKGVQRNATRYKGTAMKWNEGKGFGFIQPDVGYANMFAHTSECFTPEKKLHAGLRVEYCIGFNSEGRSEATRITVEGGKVEDARK